MIALKIWIKELSQNSIKLFPYRKATESLRNNPEWRSGFWVISHQSPLHTSITPLLPCFDSWSGSWNLMALTGHNRSSKFESAFSFSSFRVFGVQSPRNTDSKWVVYMDKRFICLPVQATQRIILAPCVAVTEALPQALSLFYVHKIRYSFASIAFLRASRSVAFTILLSKGFSSDVRPCLYDSNSTDPVSDSQ